MVIIKDDGKTISDEPGVDSILATLMQTTENMINTVYHGDDEMRFRTLMGGILGVKRLHKISDSNELEKDVDIMMDQIWESVKVVNNYIDSFKKDKEG